MKTADGLVRHFAISEALFRGTAVAANLILLSIIATEKGFGAEGILISAFLMLTISGLLEIPTGRFADRRGWYRSVDLGLRLKVLTTLCYVAAVLCVQSKPYWSWLFISAEAVIDSFANSFISGAYQAAYTHWYEHHQAANKISKADAPPLFIASFRHGFLLRIFMPASAILLGSVLFGAYHGRQGGLPVYLGLLAYIMALRFLVIYRTRADLKDLAPAQSEAPAAAADYPSLLEILETRFNSLLLCAFGTFIYSACAFYLYGEIYRSLVELVPGVRQLWTGGTVIGLLLHMSTILLTRITVGPAQAANEAQMRQWMPALIGLFSLSGLCALLFSSSEHVHIAALFLFSLTAMTSGTALQRWVSSREGALLRPAIRATWFSLAEVIGALGFGFLAGLSIISDVPRAGVWILLFAIGLAGLSLSSWVTLTKSQTAGTKMSLKQYLGFTLVGISFAFFIAISIFEVRSFVETSRLIKRDSHQLFLRVLQSGLREPVIQGSFTEVAGRLDEIVRERKDLCIEVALEGRRLGDCSRFKGRLAVEHLTESIYFDQYSENLAAEIHLYGDYSDIQSGARKRLLVGLVSYLFLGGVLFLVINLSSRRIHREVGQLLDPASPNASNFLIREFGQLRAELSSAQKLKEENLRVAAFGEVARQVAHDIRSPLSALEVASADVAGLPEERRVLIRSAVDRIRDIANSLLARQGPSGGREEAPSVVLLSGLIEPVVSEKRLQSRSRPGAVISGQLDALSYGLFAKVQPVEFKRALSNLIDNAVEALEGRSGAVRVSLEARDGRVLVIVGDDGKGIAPELLARLGRRGESHGKARGLGLGLYHARTCAEAWGGGLEIASTPGQGTSVSLYFPQARAPAWFVSRLALDPGRPVVILDDDTSIHHIWKERLRSHDPGLEPFHFSTPGELRDWASARPGRVGEALYLLDYELLGYAENGLSLASELGIGESAVLVTSRFEEPEILAECIRLKVRMIPKSLAGFVPISVGTTRKGCATVLIDDDPLVRMVWQATAKASGRKLMVFAGAKEFLAAADGLAKDACIYVDSDLGDGVRGEEFARQLHARGFDWLFLTTGHSPESFPPMPWIKAIIGKEAPWA